MNLGASSDQSTCGKRPLRKRGRIPGGRSAIILSRRLAWTRPTTSAQRALNSSTTGFRALLDHRSFVRFWIARLTGGFANQMQAVAVGWQMYALTGSALDLGLVGLAQFAPSLALLLVVGHVADRYDRRRVLALCQLIDASAST